VHKHPLTGVAAVDVASVDVAAAAVWGWFIKLKKERKKKFKRNVFQKGQLTKSNNNNNDLHIKCANKFHVT